VVLSPACAQDFLDLATEWGNVTHNRLPYPFIVDEIVAMREEVSESDDDSCMFDPVSNIRIDTNKTIYRLSDDFEVTLHRLSQQSITAVVFERPSTRNILYEGCGIANVVKKFGRFAFHKAFGACGRSRERNTGS